MAGSSNSRSIGTKLPMGSVAKLAGAGEVCQEQEASEGYVARTEPGCREAHPVRRERGHVADAHVADIRPL